MESENFLQKINGKRKFYIEILQKENTFYKNFFQNQKIFIKILQKPKILEFLKANNFYINFLENFI